MAIYDTEIEVEQGSSYTNVFGFFNPDPSGLGDPSSWVPIDFTGCHARMMVRVTQDPTSTQLLSLLDTGPSPGLVFTTTAAIPGGPPIPTVNNAIQITITKTQSLALSGGTYYYDLFVDFSNGTSLCWQEGPFKVGSTVTRVIAP